MYREALEPKANDSCPLCGFACYKDSDDVLGAILVVCPVCGKFRYALRAELFFNDLRARPNKLGYKLSHYLRSISDRAKVKRENSYFPVYTDADLAKIAESHDPSVNEKLQLLLRHLAGQSEFPGQQIAFDSLHDFSVLCAKNRDEADFYLRALNERGLVSAEWTMDPETSCSLTSLGWQEFERLQQSGTELPNAFIAMWFDASLDAVKEAIQSAISESGYIPIRMDEIEHVNRIDDEIIARIRQSKFLVADFTGQRNGVYFEAGFMLGLGRPVIWLCRESDLDHVHFDTRQYNTIAYTDVDILKSKLRFRIEAIIGKGPVPFDHKLGRQK